MKYFIILCFSLTSFAQTNRNSLNLRFENDKVANTDKYYTSGLFFEYERLLSNDFFFFKAEESQLQLKFTLGNVTYTPSVLNSFNPNNFDRPYAGYQFLDFQIKQIKENQSYAYNIEVGVSGEISGAGKFQKWWHETINIEVPTWTQEIENKFLVNLKSQFVFNINIDKNNALHYIVAPAVGLRAIYIENGFDYFVGKLNTFNQSSRSGIRSNKTKEIYGILGFSYRYVLHNTLIQGSLDYKDADFTASIKNSLFKSKIGLAYKNEKSLWQFILHYNTAETPQSTNHTYGSLTYGFSF